MNEHKSHRKINLCVLETALSEPMGPDIQHTPVLNHSLSQLNPVNTLKPFFQIHFILSPYTCLGIPHDVFPWEFQTNSHIYFSSTIPAVTPHPHLSFFGNFVYSNLFFSITINKVRKQSIMLTAKRLVVKSNEWTPKCNVIQIKINLKPLRGLGHDIRVCKQI